MLGVGCWTYLERFIEADDVGVTELTQDSCLAMQMLLLVILLELASVDDLNGHLHNPQGKGTVRLNINYYYYRGNLYSAFCHSKPFTT